MDFILGYGAPMAGMRTIIMEMSSSAEGRQRWTNRDWQLRARTRLVECYAATFSFSTLPSGHSRLAWYVLFLLGHAFHLSNRPAWAAEAYRRAIEVSVAERETKYRPGSNRVTSRMVRGHHRQCSEAALSWDPPDVDLAAKAFELGECEGADTRDAG
jgi:hypothetical protein